MKRFLKSISLIGMLVASSLSYGEGDQRRVWIQFTPGSGNEIAAAVSAARGTTHYRFDQVDAIAATVPAARLAGLKKNPNVLFIEEDPKRYPTQQEVPYGIDAVQARDVWDYDRDGVLDSGAPSGAGRRICVIDSGIHATHEDLQGANIIGGEPADWNTDGCGHGTHVTGTIAAVNNTTGVVGVAIAPEIYAVKVFDGPSINKCSWTYSSSLVNAAQRCVANGAQIISMSLGGTVRSRTEDRAFANIYKNDGVLSIAAAGNGGGSSKSYPASYNSVISVAAVGSNNVVAGFSQQNSQVELAAPGVGVLSTLPSGYASWSGTSMATPHVSAVAALIWSSDPSKTNNEVRDAMNQSALDLGDAGRDNAYGYGLVQAHDAWNLFGGNGTGNVPPIASFTANCANLTCSFDAGASNDPDGSIVSYYWDFGDGASSSGLYPSHVFAAGSFSVTLTVTDDSGATGSLTQAVSAGTSTSDDTPPVISNVSSAKTKGTRFVITWDTDEPASSEVIFDCCGSFSDSALVTSHSMSFRGSKGVLYEYVVRSTDAAGNTSTSTDTYQN